LNYTLKQQQIALTFLSGIGSRRARIILHYFSDLDSFFEEKHLNLAKIPGVPADFVTHQHRLAALEAAEKVCERLEKMNASTVFFTEDDYPRRLKQCPDAPLLLYAKGAIDWNPDRVIAVVGTRHATTYGKQLTEELINGLSESGTTVISGMAYGIDITAHTAALQHRLPTIGVLGHGLHTIYPSEHVRIAREMIHCGGLVSEFAPGLKPEPAYFPMRNRIVAGMADATVVVESGAKGGSLITAHIANDYNRDVFAFPGDVHRELSIGCLKLIQQNKAHLLTGSKDLLRFMNWNLPEKKKTVQRELFTDLSEDERAVLTILQEKPLSSVDVVSHLSGLTPAAVSAVLLQLEFKGIIQPLAGKRYNVIQ
jgi:DNA processing protein